MEFPPLFSEYKITRYLLFLILVGLFLVACAGDNSADPQQTEVITVASTSVEISPDDNANTERIPGEKQITQSAEAEESEPAVADGFVYEDLNNNSQFDEEEPGISGLSIVALSPNGQRIIVTTDSNGYFRFEEPSLQHRIFVNSGFFPESFVLTTENEFYDISVLPGDIRSGLNFGYRDRELSTIIGTVYDDLNGNGKLDEGEPGLAGILVLAIAHGEELGDASELTDEDGRFRFDFTNIDHQIMVDETSIPEGFTLMSEPGVYPLFVPPGFVAFDIDFGYGSTDD